MLRTITIGSCVSVQGMFLNETSGGRISMEVDGRVFEGKPVIQSKVTPKAKMAS